MGCRPSRRAVACVRVAGEGGGPWGVGRSHNRPHPLHSVGDGVRLRRRSLQRRNGDVGGGDSGGCNPRDRYSAPPMDRQFPPHSCTSATYEHGRCKGTSRITLRLSKNGSTLEIEKCDFQHDRSTCQHCGPETSSSEESNHISSLLRTQSAPNLHISASASSNSICPPPRPPRHTKRQEVDVEFEMLPPPLPPRHRDSLSVGRVDVNTNTPLGSVRTATRVDVNMESVCPSPQSSMAWGVCDSVDARVETERDYLSCNESDSSDCVRVDIHAQNTSEPCSLQEKVVLVLPEHNANRNAEYVHFPCCHAHDSNLAPTLNFMEQVVKSELNNSLPNHHVLARELVDLTAFHSTNSHVMPGEADIDVDCLLLGSQNQRLLKPGQNLAACKERGLTGFNNCTSDVHCLRPAHFSDDIDGISITSASSDYQGSKRQSTPGATDYRIMMLGAGCSEITSHLTSSDMQGASGVHLLSADISHSSSQLIQGMNVTRMMHDAASNGSFMTEATNSSQLTSSASESSKLDQQSDESTDTGCESDDEGERSQLLARLEMAPTYVHADFKNDFGDLFDDSSPGLDTS